MLLLTLPGTKYTAGVMLCQSCCLQQVQWMCWYQDRLAALMCAEDPSGRSNGYTTHVQSARAWRQSCIQQPIDFCWAGARSPSNPRNAMPLLQ